MYSIWWAARRSSKSREWRAACGIAKCDTIAEALIAAAKNIGFKIPVVVRLEGTNVDRARELLKEAAIEQLIPAADLADAAEKVCKQVA